MGLATAIAIGAGAISAIGSASQASRARKRSEALGRDIKAAEDARQDIINPYEGVKDLSGMITNPFANLQVATKAAEMQAEEADISLASTLDTLRATGAGSAGATALAQAALRSKQGIAATIEQQEAQNVRLRAQGEQQAQQMRMAEAQRLQQAEVAGKQFVFGAREEREIQQLNRAAGLAQQARAGAQAAQASMYGALGSFAGQAVGMAGQGAFGQGKFAQAQNAGFTGTRSQFRQANRFLNNNPGLGNLII